MPAPLNMEILLPAEALVDREFHDLIFPNGSSAEFAAQRALAMVHANVIDWHPIESEAMRSAIMNEVEEVVNILREWMTVFKQAVVLPEQIEVAKQRLMDIPITDIAAHDAQWRTVRAMMAEVRMNADTLRRIQSEVYARETPSQELVRLVGE